MNPQELTVGSSAWVKAWNHELNGQTPQEILRFALASFDEIVFACSFGSEDVVLVDMLHKIKPETAIFYLDTDLLFTETYEVRDRMIEKYNPNLIQFRPRYSLEEQAAEFGPDLWYSDPNRCCDIRKVEPLQRALAGYRTWITGIRREQAPTRAHAGVVETDHKFGLVKFNPLATWSYQQVWDYIHEYQVPYNRLHDQGYPSIGCTHCTRAVQPGEDPRAGRWANFSKTECGLHK